MIRLLAAGGRLRPARGQSPRKAAAYAWPAAAAVCL